MFICQLIILRSLCGTLSPADPDIPVYSVCFVICLNVCVYARAHYLSVFSQVQMYQLSRLLHDYHRELYNHLEEHEISPSLYAAPWFLTLYASQFPLNFVSRVFGIFLE